MNLSVEEEELTVENHERIPVPICGGDSLRLVCADLQCPAETATDGNVDTLTPWATSIFRYNSFTSLETLTSNQKKSLFEEIDRYLSDSIELLIGRVRTIAVDCKHSAAATTTTVATRKDRVPASVKSEIPH